MSEISTIYIVNAINIFYQIKMNVSRNRDFTTIITIAIIGRSINAIL